MEIENILNLKINSPDFPDNMTIKMYFRKLLFTLWDEGEGFSGKRPFGNSGWEFDLYKPLVEAKIVKGSLDEYGYVEDVDTEEANKIIFTLIDYCFL